jgi:hypothetical protein
MAYLRIETVCRKTSLSLCLIVLSFDILYIQVITGTSCRSREIHTGTVITLIYPLIRDEVS